MQSLDIINDIFLNRQDVYLGEAVTTVDHMLQCAALAEREGAPEAVILASLFHDIGHFHHEFPDNCADMGIDSRHEDTGSALLEPLFGPEVTEPVRLHVDAKRYLCAVEPTYFAKLSPASVHSLNLQGGPMSEAETKEFRRNPHHSAAVHVRRLDERGKEAGMDVPRFDHYQEMIKRHLKA